MAMRGLVTTASHAVFHVVDLLSTGVFGGGQTGSPKICTNIQGC